MTQSPGRRKGERKRKKGGEQGPRTADGPPQSSFSAGKERVRAGKGMAEARFPSRCGASLKPNFQKMQINACV